ncbi:hypothetical protein MAJ_03302, partial [Metarhizium majus ARSEF 297]
MENQHFAIQPATARQGASRSRPAATTGSGSTPSCPATAAGASCTLYSSPNLPSNLTLDYDEAKSSGFQPLSDANNPQVGGNSPLTFLDDAGTKPDPDGVSGFTAIDQNGVVWISAKVRGIT